MKDLISRKVLQREIEKLYDLNYGEILIDPREFYEMVDCQETIYVSNCPSCGQKLATQKASITYMRKRCKQMEDKQVDDRTKCPNCGEWCYLTSIDDNKEMFNCSRDCKVVYDEDKHFL